MDNSDHKAIIDNAINRLDIEIEQQRDLLEALEDARDVLQLYTLPIAGGKRMTRAEVIDYLEISNSSLERYIRGYTPKGRLPFPLQVGKVGHKALFKRADIVTWKETFTPPDRRDSK